VGGRCSAARRSHVRRSRSRRLAPKSPGPEPRLNLKPHPSHPLTVPPSSSWMHVRKIFRPSVFPLDTLCQSACVVARPSTAALTLSSLTCCLPGILLELAPPATEITSMPSILRLADVGRASAGLLTLFQRIGRRAALLRVLAISAIHDDHRPWVFMPRLPITYQECSRP